MPRAKHGKDDHERGLPDNSMQPQGSGTDTWFQEQILALLPDSAGPALIEASKAHGARRYTWMAEQLATQGYPDLATQYRDRKRADAAALRIRDKERIIRQCEAQLATTTDPARRAFLERGIANAKAYLDQHMKPEPAPSEEEEALWQEIQAEAAIDRLLEEQSEITHE